MQSGDKLSKWIGKCGGGNHWKWTGKLGPAYGEGEHLGHTSGEDGEWGELFKMFKQKKRKNKGHMSSYGNALEVTTLT